MPGLDPELSDELSNYEPYLPRFDGYLEEKPEAVEIREFIQDLKFNENIEKNNSRGFDYNLDIDITNPDYQLHERYADAGITGEVIEGFSLVEGSEKNSDNRAFGLNNMPKQIKIG
jgi:hypothetical protein